MNYAYGPGQLRYATTEGALVGFDRDDQERKPIARTPVPAAPPPRELVKEYGRGSYYATRETETGPIIKWRLAGAVRDDHRVLWFWEGTPEPEAPKAE